MSRTLATYNLKHPIIRETRDAQGQEHEEVLREAGACIVVKRPRAKDLKIMDQFAGRDIAGSMALLCRVSTLSEEEVELLDADDLGELGNLLGKASTSGQTTGQPA